MLNTLFTFTDTHLVLYEGFQTISDFGFQISEKTKIPFLSQKKKLILPKSNIRYPK